MCNKDLQVADWAAKVHVKGKMVTRNSEAWEIR